MKKIILCSIISTMFLSCDNLLTINPENAVNADKALKTISGNVSTLMSSYANLQVSTSYGRRMIAGVEVMADNAKVAVSHANLITNEGRNLAGSHCNNWTIAYTVIRNTNFVIEAIDNVPEIASTDAASKRLIKGEAYFLRGWQFFDLARVYSREPNHLIPGFEHGIILQTKAFIFNGSNISEAESPRNTVSECYKQIISDLNMAFDLMKDVDKDNFPYRASAVAAKALLARVYLYQENYDEAINAATWVINNIKSYNGGATSITAGDYTSVFSKGTETVFGLVYKETDGLGNNSLHAVYTNTGLLDPTSDNPDWYRDEKRGSGYGDVLFSIALYNTFDPADSRLSVFKRVIRGNNTANPERGIWCYKFNGYNGGYGIDNIPIIRLSEMYHIRIESNLRKAAKDEMSAINDLNFMRQARNLSVVKDITGQDLINLATEERRKEFLGEGHRFFELKRMGLSITKSPEAKAVGLTDLNWDDYRVVAKLPDSDAQPNGVNPNLIQNPGY